MVLGKLKQWLDGLVKDDDVVKRYTIGLTKRNNQRLEELSEQLDEPYGAVILLKGLACFSYLMRHYDKPVKDPVTGETKGLLEYIASLKD